MRVSRLLVAVFIIVLTIVAAAHAQDTAIRYWMPFRLLHFAALDAYGTPAGRYAVAIIEDREVANTCLAVITDTTTGQFVATAVPADSCHTRRH